MTPLLPPYTVHRRRPGRHRLRASHDADVPASSSSTSWTWLSRFVARSLLAIVVVYGSPTQLSGHFKWPFIALLSTWVRHFVFPVIVVDCFVAPLFSLFLRSSGRQLRHCVAQCILVVLSLCIILPHTDMHYFCATNHIVLITVDFIFTSTCVNSVLSSPPAVALGRTCIVAVNAVAVLGCGFYRGLCYCGACMYAVTVVTCALLCTVSAVGLCTAVLLYFSITGSDVYCELRYYAVRYIVRVALTVYATVVPLYFRICDLYLLFRKLWHHTIRVSTDLYCGLRYYAVRCTVRVASTVYATVVPLYSSICDLYLLFRKLCHLAIRACNSTTHTVVFCITTDGPYFRRRLLEYCTPYGRALVTAVTVAARAGRAAAAVGARVSFAAFRALFTRTNACLCRTACAARLGRLRVRVRFADYLRLFSHCMWISATPEPTRAYIELSWIRLIMQMRNLSQSKCLLLFSPRFWYLCWMRKKHECEFHADVAWLVIYFVSYFLRHAIYAIADRISASLLYARLSVRRAWGQRVAYARLSVTMTWTRCTALLAPLLAKKPRRSFSRRARRSWYFKLLCAASSSLSPSNQSVAAPLDLNSCGLRLICTSAQALLTSFSPFTAPVSILALLLVLAFATAAALHFPTTRFSPVIIDSLSFLEWLWRYRYDLVTKGMHCFTFACLRGLLSLVRSHAHVITSCFSRFRAFVHCLYTPTVRCLLRSAHFQLRVVPTRTTVTAQAAQCHLHKCWIPARRSRYVSLCSHSHWQPRVHCVSLTYCV
jgi:hypothetical protein